MYKLGLSRHREEIVFLSVEAEIKKKVFRPGTRVINKFGVFRRIIVNPAPILLSQKLLAVLGRRRAKGRDFYDASFLAAVTKPDFGYVKKIKGWDREEFSKKLIEHCHDLDYKHLARDVAPFLFDPGQQERILNFQETLPEMLA